MRHRLLLCLLPFAAACGEEPPPTSFIALQRDFQAFPTWETFRLRPEPDGESLHAGGERDLYLSQRPRRGSAGFPVGTIIVKHADGAGTPDGPRTYAMVKRGGDYNLEGAANWEWFELVPSELNPSNWLITWRGLGPPIGAEYGNTGQTCNDCHALARENDFVKAPVLGLRAVSR
ncbi:MAG TPA: hypothetical protein VK447_10275 [Myxococcaceae bacterium]|nr:hypothetical protein [Myxococcaceae bacterium]